MAEIALETIAPVSPRAPSPDSEVRVTGGNGHGSTNTRIRRFTTVLKNVGNAITYADSATDGGSFTINEAGVYTIIFSDRRTSSGSQVGLSKNSSQLTTNISGIADADRLAFTSASAGNADIATATVQLEVGDIIRAHTDSSNDSTDAHNVWFQITQLYNLDKPVNTFREDNLSLHTTWTPTLAASTTNPTLGSGSTARATITQVGNTVFGSGLFIFGTSGTNAGSGTYTVNLPSGYTPDESIISDNDVIGHGYARDANASSSSEILILRYDAVSGGIKFTLYDNTAANVADNAPFVWSPSDELGFNFQIPVTQGGLSQNTLSGFANAGPGKSGLVQLQTGAATNTVADYEETSITLDNDFTLSPTCYITRVGRLVTYTILGAASHGSSSGPITSLGLVPERFRPSANSQFNVVIAGTSIITRVRTLSDGRIEVAYYDTNTGVGTPQTSTGAGFSWSHTIV